MEMMKMEAFRKVVCESDNIVFFGGAGVSTESGIPDFRSQDGLYDQQFDYPPEMILSLSFYRRKKDVFFQFYREKMLCLDAEPNVAHQKLALLEKYGKLKAVITQNIDGLHQEAGSRNVLELHGSIHRNHCEVCGKSHAVSHILKQEGIPLCTCGGTIKPDVILYEESLNQELLIKSAEYIQKADVLIIGGTSLKVYPAARLIDYFQGRHLILINRSDTGQDERADLIIRESMGQVFSQLPDSF